MWVGKLISFGYYAVIAVLCHCITSPTHAQRTAECLQQRHTVRIHAHVNNLKLTYIHTYMEIKYKPFISNCYFLNTFANCALLSKLLIFI